MQLFNNEVYIGNAVLEVRSSVSVISGKFARLQVRLNNDSKMIESIGMFYVMFNMYPPSSDISFAFGEQINQFIANQSFSTLLPIYIDVNVISSGVRECVCMSSVIGKVRVKGAPLQALSTSSSALVIYSLLSLCATCSLLIL